MRNTSWRNLVISVFVVAWTLLFHYESIRFFYLNPLFHRNLPKTKFLFPPAGWIMFFNVGDNFANAEVYGVKDGVPQFLDPHLILTTRAIGYDNIHRGALTTVFSEELKSPFCRFLRRKFPTFDNFYVLAVYWPSLTKTPQRKLQKVLYQCQE